MKRIVKAPDVRRKEIMLAALKLFETHGYSKTPVEAIIQAVGVAKGTFYYYFKSKQEIVRALVEYISEQVEAHFVSIVENNQLSALEKLQEMFVGSKKKETVNPTVMAILHLPENREIQEQLNIQSIELIAPLILKVLLQGHNEGIFHSKATLESVQVLLAGSQFILDSGLFDWTLQQRKKYLASIQAILELLVGAKPGLLNFVKSAV